MLRALVVDDNDEIRDFVSLLLQEMGFVVVQAVNGRAGMGAMEESGPFDLAVVDLYMPEMDGLEFIKAVRAEPAFRSMKLIMATNAGLEKHVKQALAAGADEYLMKTFLPQMLRDKLVLLKLLPS
jgi:two-component system chemotaxis response regulator CheY